MRFSVTPARRRGVEFLDDPSTPPDVRRRAMADVVRSNRLFGGTRAASRALNGVLRRLSRNATLLDVGTGMADLPARFRLDALDFGVTLTTFGVDISEAQLQAVRAALDATLCGDATRLPLRDNSVDVVTCSQMLHHFEAADARVVISELHRVARGWVVISDLRRSWLAAGGFWAAATTLRFHAVTRHDGVVSVLRGFTGDELRQLVRDATGVTPAIRRCAFWRVAAVWSKTAGATA